MNGPNCRLWKCLVLITVLLIFRNSVDGYVAFTSSVDLLNVAMVGRTVWTTPIHADHPGECGKHCSKKEGCLSFTYYTNSKTCQGHDYVFRSDEGRKEPGAIYYHSNRCGIPNEIPNAVLKKPSRDSYGNIPTGTQTYYECASNFRNTSSLEIECLSTGQWSTPKGYCEASTVTVCYCNGVEVTNPYWLSDNSGTEKETIKSDQFSSRPVTDSLTFTTVPSTGINTEVTSGTDQTVINTTLVTNSQNLTSTFKPSNDSSSDSQYLTSSSKTLNDSTSDSQYLTSTSRSLNVSTPEKDQGLSSNIATSTEYTASGLSNTVSTKESSSNTNSNGNGILPTMETNSVSIPSNKAYVESTVSVPLTEKPHSSVSQGITSPSSIETETTFVQPTDGTKVSTVDVESGSPYALTSSKVTDSTENTDYPSGVSVTGDHTYSSSLPILGRKKRNANAATAYTNSSSGINDTTTENISTRIITEEQQTLESTTTSSSESSSSMPVTDATSQQISTATAKSEESSAAKEVTTSGIFDNSSHTTYQSLNQTHYSTATSNSWTRSTEQQALDSITASSSESSSTMSYTEATSQQITTETIKSEESSAAKDVTTSGTFESTSKTTYQSLHQSQYSAGSTNSRTTYTPVLTETAVSLHVETTPIADQNTLTTFGDSTSEGKHTTDVSSRDDTVTPAEVLATDLTNVGDPEISTQILSQPENETSRTDLGISSLSQTEKLTTAPTSSAREESTMTPITESSTQSRDVSSKSGTSTGQTVTELSTVEVSARDDFKDSSTQSITNNSDISSEAPPIQNFTDTSFDNDATATVSSSVTEATSKNTSSEGTSQAIKNENTVNLTNFATTTSETNNTIFETTHLYSSQSTTITQEVSSMSTVETFGSASFTSSSGESTKLPSTASSSSSCYCVTKSLFGEVLYTTREIDVSTGRTVNIQTTTEETSTSTSHETKNVDNSTDIPTSMGPAISPSESAITSKVTDGTTTNSTSDTRPSTGQNVNSTSVIATSSIMSTSPENTDIGSTHEGTVSETYTSFEQTTHQDTSSTDAIPTASGTNLETETENILSTKATPGITQTSPTDGDGNIESTETSKITSSTSSKLPSISTGDNSNSLSGTNAINTAGVTKDNSSFTTTDANKHST